MSAIEAAGLWAALNAILLIVSSGNVGRMRMKHKVSLGDGGNEELLKAIRAQGNYIEYAPVMLVCLVIASMMGAGALLIHALGAVFFAARVAYFADMGLGAFSGGRRFGTMLTMLSLLATAIVLIYFAFT